MKTFEDLVFKPHILAKEAKEIRDDRPEVWKQVPSLHTNIDALHAKMILNGKELSVIFGEMFYSNGVDTYEAWNQTDDNEPRGYLTKDEVTQMMKEMQS